MGIYNSNSFFHSYFFYKPLCNLANSPHHHRHHHQTNSHRAQFLRLVALDLDALSMIFPLYIC